jgi:hypothetical protein
MTDALSRKGEHIPQNPEEDLPTTLFPPEHFCEIATEITQLDGQEYIDIIIVVIEEAILLDQQIQDQIQTLLPLVTIPDLVTLLNGLAYYGERIYIPDNPTIRAAIMRLYHDSPIAGHLGQQGTLELVQRVYWWPGQSTYIRDYVRGCHACAQQKHWNQQVPGTLHVLPTLEGPWEWTQLDHIVGLPRSRGYDAIYVIMDHLTKMAHFIPSHTSDTVEDLVQLHL